MVGIYWTLFEEICLKQSQKEIKTNNFICMIIWTFPGRGIENENFIWPPRLELYLAWRRKFPALLCWFLLFYKSSINFPEKCSETHIVYG